MATQSHAGKAIALRERYEKLSVALRGESQFQSDQAERRTIGRYQALEYLAANLSSIVAGMRPAQVHEVILRELHRLAEAKATWLVNSIRKRREYHINELGEWTAEGAIAQIDEMVPELCGLLLPRLTPAPRIHSRYFQLWKPLAPDGVDDLQRIATRWAWAREHWHREVAILEFDDENVSIDRCYQVIALAGRRGGPRLLWSLDGADLAQPGRGDVIVSLLSGEAWLLDGTGLRQVSAILGAPTAAARSGGSVDPADPFARFADRYRLALRIDAGPLPDSLICSDPFFEALAERYQGKTPPHDLWKLALYFLDEGGQARAGCPELSLAWECDWRPTFEEVLGILQDMIDTVWDAPLRCCSREVWDEYGYGCDYTEPGEEDRVYGVQCWNVARLLGFLGDEAFDALLDVEG
jgi:hypothetical protein